MTTVKKIFLIDDDPLYIFLTKEIISATNIETNIFEFNNGQEVLDYFKKNYRELDLLPDVIFLDLHMQIMDGWEFLEEYIAIQPLIEKKIELYIVSSSISPYDIERSKSMKVISDFIIKPIEQQKFIEIINNTISS